MDVHLTTATATTATAATTVAKHQHMHILTLKLQSDHLSPGVPPQQHPPPNATTTIQLTHTHVCLCLSLLLCADFLDGSPGVCGALRQWRRVDFLFYYTLIHSCGTFSQWDWFCCKPVSDLVAGCWMLEAGACCHNCYYRAGCRLLLLPC